ncbi:MAG: phosphate ABC transporter permease [Chloroflexi bacterium RBG_16_58_14]|nr:MAG: phosphate ABC transporter permease [Chloroflexi bacterium RBG_16_58_14]
MVPPASSTERLTLIDPERPMSQTTITHRPSEEILVLRPSRGWSALNLIDLWRYRELIYFLIWRDVKVRYKQTALGASWAIIQPFVTMVVFTILFGNLAKMPSDGIPYPLFSYTGLLPWGLFTKALSDAGRSMITNRSMITKVYFPRLAIPIASVLSGLVDFALAFVVLIGMILFYNNNPNLEYQVVLTPAILTLPLFLLLALITSLGVGLWLSALNVQYRDINYIIPFLTQFWLFITPIAYPASMIPEKWQLLYALNPMAGVVEGFRWALLGVDTAPGPMIAVSASIAVTLMISGLYYFRRMERTFADEI